MTRISLLVQTQNLQKIIKNNPNPQTILENQRQEDKDITHIYQEFIDCIKEHNHQYYNLSDSLISDQEYDELFAYLKKIEEIFPHLISSTSPTQNLQDQLEVQSEFKKAKHIFLMKSLENSYSQDDIIERTERAERVLGKNKPPLTSLTQTPQSQTDLPCIPSFKEGPKRKKPPLGGEVPAKQGVGSDVEEAQQEVKFILEPKFDGVAIALIYID